MGNVCILGVCEAEDTTDNGPGGDLGLEESDEGSGNGATTLHRGGLAEMDLT